MSNKLPSNVEKLLNSWNTHISENEKIHRTKALSFRKLYYALGISATLLSGLYTISSFSTISNCDPYAFCIVETIIGAIATTLISVQTYMQLMSRFFNHKIASDRYQALERTIQTILNSKNEGDPANILGNIHNIFDDIVETSPILPVSNGRLKFSIFNRKTRTKFQNNQMTDVEKGFSPASKEELEIESKKDICIDQDTAEKMINFHIDPELKYQMDRLYSKIKK